MRSADPMDRLPEDPRVLIVDDNEDNIALLDATLRRAGYRTIETTRSSLDIVTRVRSFRPDIVLLDLRMPVRDGLGVLDDLTPHRGREPYLPVLMLSAETSRQARQSALAAGASDFVSKPFDLDEVLLRIANLLRIRRLTLQLQEHNRHLHELLAERTDMLEASRTEALHRLALAAEFRDDETSQHTRRVGVNAGRLARLLGWTPDAALLLERSAPLHDVGKIGISDTILLKDGPLTDEEYETIKSHTTIGARILGGSTSPLLQLGERVAMSHHERWDGRGYPRGLAGTDIPAEGRIVAIIDTFDVITHDRPYKTARSAADAIHEIARCSGAQFDPEMVEVFVAVCREDPASWVEPVVDSELVRSAVDTDQIRSLLKSTDSYLRLSDSELAAFDDGSEAED